MSKKSFFRSLIGLLLALSVFLMPTAPALGYDVVRQFGPITIGDATITIQLVESLTDDVRLELHSLKTSGLYDSVGIPGDDYLNTYPGRSYTAFMSAFYANYVVDDLGVFVLIRENAAGFSKTALVLKPIVTLTNFQNGIQSAKLNNSMIYFSPIQFNDDLGWASSAISKLVNKGILIATSGNDIEKSLFRSDNQASRLDASCWLSLAFPKNTDKDVVAAEWGNDKQVSEVYRPDLGYEVYLSKNQAIQPNPYGITPIAMFGLVDSALKTKVLVPYTDGKLGLSDPVARADFAYMVAKTMGWQDQPEVGLRFWDMRDPRWQNYTGAIGACVAHGILSGYSDNGFWPEETPTRAEVACAIYKLLGLGEPPRNPSPRVHNEKILTFQIGSPTMAVNGVPHLMDVAPVIVESRTFLPIRYVAENLEAKVDWDQVQQKVTITSSSTQIQLWVGNSVALVNGKERAIDLDNSKVVPFILPPGRTMLPLRFVSEALGASVNWMAEDQSITILFDPASTSTPSGLAALSP